MKYRCPRCGSTNIDYEKELFGAMWCVTCGYRIYSKNAVPNPFIVEEPGDQRPPDPPPASLGEQMAQLVQKRRCGKRKTDAL